MNTKIEPNQTVKILNPLSVDPTKWCQTTL